MSRPPSFDTPPRRRLIRELIFEDVQSTPQPVSADRVPGLGQTEPAPCALIQGRSSSRIAATWTTRVWGAHGAGGVLRHPAQGQCRLRGHRAAPPPERSQVRRDEVTRLTGVDEATKDPHRLRRVEIYDPEQELTLAFLTNHLTFGATTCLHLQGPVADRAVLQGAQAEPEDQDFVGTQRQCPKGPGLDGLGRDAAPALPAAPVALRLVPVEPARAVADEPVYASPLVGLVGSAVLGAAADRRAPSGGAGPWRIRTAEPEA